MHADCVSEWLKKCVIWQQRYVSGRVDQQAQAVNVLVLEQWHGRTKNAMTKGSSMRNLHSSFRISIPLINSYRNDDTKNSERHFSSPSEVENFGLWHSDHFHRLSKSCFIRYLYVARWSPTWLLFLLHSNILFCNAVLATLSWSNSTHKEASSITQYINRAGGYHHALSEDIYADKSYWIKLITWILQQQGIPSRMLRVAFL